MSDVKKRLEEVKGWFDEGLISSEQLQLIQKNVLLELEPLPSDQEELFTGPTRVGSSSDAKKVGGLG